MIIAGFDIGGANTDLAIIKMSNNNFSVIKTDFKYFPMWLKKDELEYALLDLVKDEIKNIDAIGICMTAELVDAYKTKDEGVIDIASKARKAFDKNIGFVSLNGILNYEDVIGNPDTVAAANWIATSKIASKIAKNCIMIDTGSTTTDIIPIKEGKECAKGRSDLERLKYGELVYSGTLRTNVATLVDKVPLNNEYLRVSSELFAITADVNLVLGNITEKDYSCDTPDGAGKSKMECMRRIARVVCGDLQMLSEKEIQKIADFIYKKQVEKIAEALIEVSKREKLDMVVTTGLGMNVIGAKAAKLAGLKWKNMDEILKNEECIVAPAVGTALMIGEYLG